MYALALSNSHLFSISFLHFGEFGFAVDWFEMNNSIPLDSKVESAELAEKQEALQKRIDSENRCIDELSRELARL